MVVKMAEVKVEKLEPTLYDIKVEEVSSTPALLEEASAIPSESTCSIVSDETDSYTVEQIPETLDSEKLSSKCLPRSSDEGGVEIVYLETSSSASSLSSRTLTNQEEWEDAEDHSETDIDFDRILIEKIPVPGQSSSSNLMSEMPDIVQDASASPISKWLQNSEPAMESSITSLESDPRPVSECDTRPASLIEDSAEEAISTKGSSESRNQTEPSIKDTFTQTLVPQFIEDTAAECDHSNSSDLKVSDTVDTPKVKRTVDMTSDLDQNVYSSRDTLEESDGQLSDVVRVTSKDAGIISGPIRDFSQKTDLFEPETEILVSKEDILEQDTETLVSKTIIPEQETSSVPVKKYPFEQEIETSISREDVLDQEPAEVRTNNHTSVPESTILAPDNYIFEQKASASLLKNDVCEQKTEDTLSKSGIYERKIENSLLICDIPELKSDDILSKTDISEQKIEDVIIIGGDCITESEDIAQESQIFALESSVVAPVRDQAKQQSNDTVRQGGIGESETNDRKTENSMQDIQVTSGMSKSKDVAKTLEIIEEINQHLVLKENTSNLSNRIRRGDPAERLVHFSELQAPCQDTLDISHTKQASPKALGKVQFCKDVLDASLERETKESSPPDLDTLISSLQRIAETEIPVRRSPKPDHIQDEPQSPVRGPMSWPEIKNSSKNPIARMIEDFFKSKRRKGAGERERCTVTSPTYRPYSDSLRSTEASSVTSPVTSRSQTPCSVSDRLYSQENSYYGDTSRNGSLSPALLRELETVLKSRPFNRYVNSESSSQGSPIRAFHPQKTTSCTRSSSRSPNDSEFMSPPPYSRQVSSSSAASQSTAVYNPRLSPVSSDETESTFTSKEPEKSSERRGLFEQVFRAINLRKGFSTAVRPSKLNLKEPKLDRREARTNGYPRSPRLHRSASEPENITRFGESVSPVGSPPPARNGRGQSLATERTLADGKLVFLSSPPLATSPPPCGRSTTWRRTHTGDSSHILLCLSPSQRRCFKNRLPTPEESADLLDLHQKFIERRAYHESPAPPPRKHSPKPRSVYADTIDWINSIPLYSSEDDGLASGENGESGDPLRTLPSSPRPDGYRRTSAKVSAENNAEIDLSELLAILRDECEQHASHERLHSSDQHAAGSMSPWFTPRSKDPSDLEPVTYVLHAGGKNKYEFRSDCAKNAAINIAKRIEETANKVKWKTEGDVSCSKSFSSILKDKLFWNLNHIVDSKEVRHTPPKPIPKSSSADRLPVSEKVLPAYKISQQGDIAHLRDKRYGDSSSLYEDLSPGSKYWKERNLRAKTHSKENLKKDRREVVSRINVHQNQVLPSPPTKHKQPHPKSRPINPSEEERLRDQMYEEYMHQVAERNRRREQKVIKISDPDSVTVNSDHRKDDGRPPSEPSVPRGVQLEQEFMDKVRARMAKYGMVENGGCDAPVAHHPGAEEKNCVVMRAAGSQKEAKVTAVQQLPKHLQEFLSFTVQDEQKIQAEEAEVGKSSLCLRVPASR